MDGADQFGPSEYVRLMKDFLACKISAMQYCRKYFSYSSKRLNILTDELDEIIQRAYGDADDYEEDPVLRKQDSAWINEDQLREKVSKSLYELESRGY